MTHYRGLSKIALGLRHCQVKLSHAMEVVVVDNVRILRRNGKFVVDWGHTSNWRTEGTKLGTGSKYFPEVKAARVSYPDLAAHPNFSIGESEEAHDTDDYFHATLEVSDNGGCSVKVVSLTRTEGYVTSATTVPARTPEMPSSVLQS